MSDKRVTASDRVRAEIDALFADPDRELGEVLEEIARLSVRLVMQAALEAEVTEFLGRDRYARGDRARVGHRNGYQPVTVKTTAGAVTLERPKVRGSLERVRFPAVGPARDQDQRAGIAGGLRLGARPVGPRHRSRAARDARG